MTYFQSLAIFILPPLVLFGWLAYRRRLLNRLAVTALAIHVALALIYTTPWDNYLVATGVWWYEPTQVTGVTLGYVPIEEYTFFVLQSLLTGLWLLLVMDRDGSGSRPTIATTRINLWAAMLSAGIGLLAWIVVFAGWLPGRYAALIVGWAALPITIQLGFGADLLWKRRKSVTLAILAPTIYLWLMDAVSIRSGIWIIDPQQTTGWALGPLPTEEMLFFLATNVMLVFGMTLFLAPESASRARRLFSLLSKDGRRKNPGWDTGSQPVSNDP